MGFLAHDANVSHCAARESIRRRTMTYQSLLAFTGPMRVSARLYVCGAHTVSGHGNELYVRREI